MKCAIIFCTIFISLYFCACQGALKTHYIEELCYRKYQKDALLYLKSGQSGILTSVPTESSTTDCTVRLKPEYGSSVLLSIYKYSIADEDQLTIEDSNGFKVALLGEGEFLDERKTFSSDGTLTIRYIRDSNSTLERKSRVKFQFVFTQFHDYPCNFNEFQCKNQRCIRKDLTCDRHNHCGDNSDQENCGPRDENQRGNWNETVVEEKPNVVAILTIISSLLAVIIIVIVAVVIGMAIRKKNQKKGAPPAVAATAPPAPSAPEMPPSFATRIRQSFRRTFSNTKTASTQSTPEDPKPEKYEVPAMYPHIPPPSTVPSGVDNPDFKPDE